MRSKRAIGTMAVLAALLGALVIGCGGDDGDDGGGGETVSAEDYVNDVCSGMSELTTTITSGQEEFQQALQGSLDSPEEGRDVLVSFLGDAADAAGEAHSAVEEAGVPDVDGGEEVADAITTAIGDMQGAFEQARGDAESMSTESAGEFASDAQEIATAVQASSQQIQESLQAVGENEELEAAAEDAEACQQL
ncbi:MAG TPA: hypothetical protein VK919_11615 [Solirubrobacterales bacterium]|nr:hypothetical protein [Solirubrobacterales bacterium]